MKTPWFILVALVAATAAGGATPNLPYRDPSLPVETRVEDLLQRMTLDEKIALLGGDITGFNSGGVDRLGIPPIRMSDGPAGVRNGETATAFPVPLNMAASWDPELEYRYGVALGEETRAKGKMCILGPCVDIDRYPLGGRNFESFGEDPFLSARMAVSVIEGVQSQDVIATVKHYACNDQEWNRNDYNVHVDERTLREISLRPFEAAVTEAHVRAVMTAYNIVNGEHCSENLHLVTEVLKHEWGFSGIVMSDWVSVYSADRAANHGLDVEMPQPIWFGAKLKAAVQDGRVALAVIDDKARRHLRVRFAAGWFDRPAPVKDESVIRSAGHRALAVEMAQKSIILLKNDHLLPLQTGGLKSIALIGPSARTARTGGGGSSFVQAWETVSPYDGLKALVGPDVALSFAEGVRLDPVALETIPAGALRTPDGRTAGLQAEYFDNPLLQGSPVFSRVEPRVEFEFGDGKSPDPRLKATDYSVRYTGQLVPTITGGYVLGTTSDDGSRLYIDGHLIADNWGKHGATSVMSTIHLEANRAYALRLDYNQYGGGASLQLGWRLPGQLSGLPTIADAVDAAKKADVAIVCVGNTADLEGEGNDVADFKMAGGQDDLVRAVVAANPNTIVVVYGGVPVIMQPWFGQAKAVIAAIYPGQEGGTALAQILLGAVNPSGKLPFSYIQDRSQSPAFSGYQAPDLQIHYDEGVFVGYRYYDRHDKAPLFPFGYGLSYTTFNYSNLRVEKTGDQTWVARVDITNSGPVAGAEVAQLYVTPAKAPVDRPIKELKGFAKVMLQPGETATASFALGARSFEYFDATLNQWSLAPGKYGVLVGASSQDIRLTGEVQLP
jgi:beta-glucosidase